MQVSFMGFAMGLAIAFPITETVAVLISPKSIKLNYTKGFNILDFKKHHF